MNTAFQALLLLLATATDRQLAKQVQYLKVENQILRSKLPKRLTVTARERQRLLRFGKVLGAAIRELITIVSPQTFFCWLRGSPSDTPASRRTGRPATDADLRALVLRLARENAWGYTRIHGELKKLGLAHISRTTVANILRAAGLETGPERGQSTWTEFVRRQAATLWACDFFTQRIWTLSGAVDCFVLFFLNIGSRRVFLAGLTTRPDHAWVAQQARHFCQHVATLPEQPTHLLRDRDGKFGPEFDAVLAAAGMEVVPVGPRMPNMNAFAERWVLSVRLECLNHFVVFGEEHLRYLLDQYLAFFNEHRPHQGVGNVPLNSDIAVPLPQPPSTAAAVLCAEHLGGLLKHYSQPAA
jgi:putative transposase